MPDRRPRRKRPRAADGEDADVPHPRSTPPTIRRHRPFDAGTRQQLLTDGRQLPRAERRPPHRSVSQHVRERLSDDAGYLRTEVRRWIDAHRATLEQIETIFLNKATPIWPAAHDATLLTTMVEQTLFGAAHEPFSLDRMLAELRDMSFAELCVR